ncbi:hypothetical protein ONO23_03204 [Micromonospora noduli]|uniref:Uncharacterized protein n=2 Tax=Micromonospora noduli TaxID=709876 RepID=A0A328NB74_9ACTN|nr:hypothetical protein LAH08_01470 [Micromonospora noduli]RAO07841.1 hypothetical protein LUPAC07_05770 [Micromonospora noduli]RAO19652.1 hypothetical protein MED15_02811 [Micromonospora noduli]RAO32785.1 hypothetical protein ONO23_03204 [Micromonospora noduli]RAO39885.1 hypothetical protein ONO86_04316 [Micromonospora noduli]
MPRYHRAMTSRTALRKRTKRALVAVSVTLGLLSCLWVLSFLWLQVFKTEGSLPPKSRMPEVPSGATIADESVECASGGCWRTITLVPAAGQSPEDLAREMGLSEELSLPPTVFDPASVYVGANPREGRLTVHIGYQ